MIGFEIAVRSSLEDFHLRQNMRIYLMSNTLVHLGPLQNHPKSRFKKRPRFKGRGMMNGGGVDVALAEQGFDTFKLLESLDIPYDELLKPTGEFCSFATNFCWV